MNEGPDKIIIQFQIQLEIALFTVIIFLMYCFNKNLDMMCCFYWYWSISLMCKVFANGPGDQGLIPGRVIPKTKKNGTWCHLA